MAFIRSCQVWDQFIDDFAQNPSVFMGFGHECQASVNPPLTRRLLSERQRSKIIAVSSNNITTQDN